MPEIDASREQPEDETQFIAWKHEYSVGVKKLDKQHMKIINILNDIHNYRKEKAGPLDLENILNDLLLYTRTHFADEEGLLRLVGYPKFTEHQEVHYGMAQKTQAICEAGLDDRDDLSLELLTFLRNWWVDHLENEDRRYVPYLALFMADRD